MLVSNSYVRKCKRASEQPLTEREVEIMWLVVEGLSNKLIADELHISDHTVKFHLNNAIAKCGASNRTLAAVNFVLTFGASAKARQLPRTEVRTTEPP